MIDVTIDASGKLVFPAVSIHIRKAAVWRDPRQTISNRSNCRRAAATSIIDFAVQYGASFASGLCFF